MGKFLKKKTSHTSQKSFYIHTRWYLIKAYFAKLCKTLNIWFAHMMHTCFLYWLNTGENMFFVMQYNSEETQSFCKCDANLATVMAINKRIDQKTQDGKCSNSRLCVVNLPVGQNGEWNTFQASVCCLNTTMPSQRKESTCRSGSTITMRHECAICFIHTLQIYPWLVRFCGLLSEINK